MTSTPRSASSFRTSSVKTSERPTTQITIGSRTYTARAPKTDVWREVTKMLAVIESLDEPTTGLTEDQLRERAALMKDLQDLDKLERALVTGEKLYDDEGNVYLQGGFVRRCLAKEDWQLVLAEWRDDECDLSGEDLYVVANELQAAFDDWFNGREAPIGLPKAVKPKAKPRTAAAK
jgi:hypothetical protein